MNVNPPGVVTYISLLRQVRNWGVLPPAHSKTSVDSRPTKGGTALIGRDVVPYAWDEPDWARQLREGLVTQELVAQSRLMTDPGVVDPVALWPRTELERFVAEETQEGRWEEQRRVIEELGRDPVPPARDAVRPGRLYKRSIDHGNKVPEGPPLCRSHVVQLSNGALFVQRWGELLLYWARILRRGERLLLRGLRSTLVLAARRIMRDPGRWHEVLRHLQETAVPSVPEGVTPGLWQAGLNLLGALRADLIFVPDLLREGPASDMGSAAVRLGEGGVTRFLEALGREPLPPKGAVRKVTLRRQLPLAQWVRRLFPVRKQWTELFREAMRSSPPSDVPTGILTMFREDVLQLRVLIGGLRELMPFAQNANRDPPLLPVRSFLPMLENPEEWMPSMCTLLNGGLRRLQTTLVRLGTLAELARAVMQWEGCPVADLERSLRQLGYSVASSRTEHVGVEEGLGWADDDDCGADCASGKAAEDEAHSWGPFREGADVTDALRLVIGRWLTHPVELLEGLPRAVVARSAAPEGLPACAPAAERAACLRVSFPQMQRYVRIDEEARADDERRENEKGFPRTQKELLLRRHAMNVRWTRRLSVLERTDKGGGVDRAGEPWCKAMRALLGLLETDAFTRWRQLLVLLDLHFSRLHVSQRLLCFANLIVPRRMASDTVESQLDNEVRAVGGRAVNLAREVLPLSLQWRFTKTDVKVRAAMNWWK